MPRLHFQYVPPPTTTSPTLSYEDHDMPNVPPEPLRQRNGTYSDAHHNTR
ncbi:hypothetical protein Scep_016691 [Stephania cephalantha]|uniref:Uncharacterized protein n=1 Tax=Stephania cephalantha TaxID=152367 RepID=A0AAP0NTI4_9MAGN